VEISRLDNWRWGRIAVAVTLGLLVLCVLYLSVMFLVWGVLLPPGPVPD
jgi:hypothetical protein